MKRDPWTQFTLVALSNAPADLKPEMMKGKAQLFRNSRYHVIERKISDSGPYGKLVQLSIRRNDQLAVHDWRDMQRIKNEIVGTEWTAIEVYPPESKLVDSANQYFLWCFEKLEASFMYNERLVSEETIDGAKQRPFDSDIRPKDLLTKQELIERIERYNVKYCRECGRREEDEIHQDSLMPYKSEKDKHHEFQEVPPL